MGDNIKSESQELFVANLKKLLNDKGISQVELSKLLKVSESTVGKWLLKKSNPRMPMIEKLCDIFQINSSYFFTDHDVHTPSVMDNEDITIPVLGRVVAGMPIEAINDIIGYEKITPQMASQGEHFALQVMGDSMAPRIQDGDIVIVRKQPYISNRDVAIVLISGDDATIKEVQLTQDGMTLIGWNPAVYTPHFYSAHDVEHMPVEIIGKVVELRCKM